jgi:hypothetical protein
LGRILGSFALTALPDDQSVAVLNGTTVTGLARAAADTPVANGFREGAVTNDTTNQHRRRTTIYYEHGYEERARTPCRDGVSARAAAAARGRMPPPPQQRGP